MYKLLVTEIDSNDFILNETQSFLQMPFWAKFKESNGWVSKMFNVNYENSECDFQPFTLTVLLKKISIFGLIAYVPLGPHIFYDDDFRSKTTVKKASEFLQSLSEKLKLLLPDNVFCIRFDPPWKTEILNAKGKSGNNLYNSSGEEFPEKPITKKGNIKILKALYDVQPPDSVHLNLTLTESELEANLKSKWRYNIRLANKKGVLINKLTGKDAQTSGIDIFYKLYLETAKRDGIAIHSKDYYKSLLSLVQNCGSGYNTDVAVYVASHNEEYLASIIVIFAGTQAVYLYGASSNNKRNLMPTYALQWQAICDAKNAGAKNYDFYGIPPIDDPSHPMYGLYRFKTGFGGKIVHYVGSLDVPVKSFLYKVYSVAEVLRSIWYKKIKKIIRR